MPTKSTAAKSTKSKAAKTVKKTATPKKAASKCAPKTTVKKAVTKTTTTTKKAPKMTAAKLAKAAMASRIELAKKSAEENNAQVNLTARSLKDSAIAAKDYKKPERKAATKAEAKKPAKKASKKLVYNGLPTVRGKDYAKVVAERQASAAMASRVALAEKALKSSIRETEEPKPVKKAAKKASKPAAKKAKKTVAKTMKAVDPVTAAKLSRTELAKKSVEENHAQNNLSARSKADGAKAAKGFKKPVRKPVEKPAEDSAKAEMEAIVNEMNAGARIMAMIEEVPGVPFEETIKAVQDKAAKASRAALANKKVTTVGNKPQLSEETERFYNDLDDYTMIEMFNALGVDVSLDSLKDQLSVALDIEALIESYLDKAEETGKGYTFEKDGFDVTVIPFLCRRVAATLPNKAQDNVSLAKKINEDVKRILINEGINDAAIYNDLMDDVRKILVYAQRNGVTTLAEVQNVIPADLPALVDRFMTVAYTILPGWQYNDVKYYEGFIYAVMAQFEDLVGEQNRAMMDVADLYIKHGDYQKGNVDYGYVLRENQLKDQIYFRFASVYEPFDPQRAKNIAQDALRVIDDRYDYHQKIVDILNK